MTMRTVVILRRDVAAEYWHRPYSELDALARAGTDGVALSEQPVSKGQGMARWSTPDPEDRGRAIWHTVAPQGWAAFYCSNDHTDPDVAALHFQNW